MAQRLGLAFGRVVARVDLADMGGIGTGELQRIGGIAEIVVSSPVAGEPRTVLARRQHERRAARPAPDHARGQQLGTDAEAGGLGGHEAVKLRHVLLEAAEHHVGAVLRPRRRQWRDRSGFLRVLWVLARIAEHELAGPDQILPGKALLWRGARPQSFRQPANARL